MHLLKNMRLISMCAYLPDFMVSRDYPLSEGNLRVHIQCVYIDLSAGV